MRRLFRHLAAALVIAPMTFGGCADLGEQSAAHTEVTRLENIEVVLTDPYCDTCSQEDKAILKSRSAIVRSVVELIDGAERTVDVAQFTFSVQEIADALLRAHQRGVAVRLAMHASQDQPGTRSKELQDAGLDVRFVKGRPTNTHDGLQHAKFMVVDEKTLLTGSNNFSSTGTTINEENTIIVRETPENPLLVGFACHFEAIWNADHDAAGACSNDRVVFSPSSAPRKMIRDRIRAAQTSIDVIMHHFTFTDLVKELVKAQQRGVQVRVLLNVTTKDEHSGGKWDELVQAGGQLRYKQVNEDTYQLLHHKLAIVDGTTLINGSGNWSGSAFFNNFENYVVYQHPRVLQRFRGLYHRLWTWSLDANSLVAGRNAAEQDVATARAYFGSLHGHFHAELDGRLLDDGNREHVTEDGTRVELDLPSDPRAAADHAYAYARDVGGLDFMGLSPHTKDDREGETDANMNQVGYDALQEAARVVSDESFVAMAGQEWSTNSAGNHVGVLGARAVAKTERGRFDSFYGTFLRQREMAGERPLVMLNHPKTFRTHDLLKGTWDQIFGHNLLDIEKASERNKKFNDFGLDDFAPLKDVRDSWIAGEAMPDEAVVAETLRNLWQAASPYARMMEVLPSRGNEFSSETPHNPSMSESYEEPGVFSRNTKVHTDYDYYLSHGFRLAPVASHDNHYANWGTGHTSRTAIVAARLSERHLLDAVEQRAVYASEDQNLEVRFYAAGRIPMGGRWATPQANVPARAYLADPDYAGTYTVRVYQGTIGQREVVLASEQVGVEGGWVDLALDTSGAGEHFFYLEVLEENVDRMAWSSPIWIEKL